MYFVKIYFNTFTLIFIKESLKDYWVLSCALQFLIHFQTYNEHYFRHVPVGLIVVSFLYPIQRKTATVKRNPAIDSR